ncbi:MAG: hypothetical protein KME15_25680 [Drouetiella hepatica Uher 2000/2452]|jgi:hypothetical protein|uniref:Uncharacterized protein n=1 Tax=Drouetiella hepatica Uher 2000/2452 TaxID=904376 RepID=A0A951US15_9CYAN|nr:hypothetical protein [Drouetiella hepatica Uher 2000/2452]
MFQDPSRSRSSVIELRESFVCPNQILQADRLLSKEGAIVSSKKSEQPTYVREPDTFLALFPHRFDYIYAEHSQPGQSPDWQTERRYPLADRVLLQGRYLYGVRFAAETRYCLLDIDIGSIYHPQRDALAISRILAALEPLGLASHLACTSSYSGGLHLYFPFQVAQRSWELAIAVSTSLETAGFKLAPGQLEVFPNPKPYATEENLSLYNAHRLPMQAGSYLLNSDFQPIWSDRDRFVAQWHQVELHNDIDSKALRQTLRQIKQRHYRISGKADKFLNDLNAEIELGWTGSGQTNYLLGRIAMRTYVFHPVLSGGEALQGQALVDEIIRVAQSLPGYQQWCQHQHEIEQRSLEWVRCVEASHYYPYGSKKEKPEKEENLGLSWNQQQSENARVRIQEAIASYLNQNSLPSGATARFRLLTQAGIGGSSLYRHRDLWHPEFLMLEDSSLDVMEALPQILSEELSTEVNLVDNPPHPPASHEEKSMNCVRSAFIDTYPTSLLSGTGSNPLPDKPFSHDQLKEVSKTGRNLFLKSTCVNSDLADLLVAISVQIRRLSWTKVQVRDRLSSLFNKGSQSLLTDLELVQWLEWLGDYP